eukprot:TRINITY_DN26383_c0_g1_i1.p1 TRINITY_DN26383_c0_g1~~TRINITY_DN26383_c0_g1_i1.p1  ORF type:complete len:143 (-),score=15.60 TRINITY_DN26383_c0_g1_i1:50-478(-)
MRISRCAFRASSWHYECASARFCRIPCLPFEPFLIHFSQRTQLGCASVAMARRCVLLVAALVAAPGLVDAGVSRAQTRLKEGEVCYRFCEDGSKPFVNARDACDSGLSCETTAEPGTIGFDSCNTPETCQKIDDSLLLRSED